MYFQNEQYLKDLQISYEAIVNVKELYGKTILVTGANGLIGGCLIDLLLYMNDSFHAQITVFALGRDSERLKKRFGMHLTDEKLQLIIQDVTDPIEIGSNSEIDYIIHAAGDGYPLAFKEHPVETMTPAFIGTLNLLKIAQKRNTKRFLFISSGEVYGKNNGEKIEINENDYGMIDSMDSRSCYPIAKRAAETLCVSFSKEYQIDSVVVRPGHIFGATVSANDNRASVQFLKNALIGKEIILYSKGLQLRSYTYVADCTSAILSVLINGQSGLAYNIANPKSRVTISEFAKILSQIAGVRYSIQEPDEEQKSQMTPIEYAVLNSDRLESLGWQGRYSIEDGIKAMYYVGKENKS